MSTTRILIVDDNRRQAHELHAAIMEKYDFLEIDMAFDVQDAIDKVQSRNYHFGILDINLSPSSKDFDASGFAIAKLLTSQKVPFVFLTMYPEDFFTEARQLFPPVEFIHRPISTKYFVQKIGPHLEQYILASKAENDRLSKQKQLIHYPDKRCQIGNHLVMDSSIHYIKGDGSSADVSFLPFEGYKTAKTNDSLAKITLTIGLSVIEPILEENEDFIRVHKSWIINMTCISELLESRKMVSLKNVPEPIPVSRKKWTIFKKRYYDEYYFRNRK
jgi:DNA-binding LytR/AlgR family response regulator